MSGHRQAHTSPKVALRKESVDRNLAYSWLSAWIAVALRKESVDRNKRYINKHLQKYLVALRKESVDRNPGVLGWSPVGLGRSPQGERG